MKDKIKISMNKSDKKFEKEFGQYISVEYPDKRGLYFSFLKFQKEEGKRNYIATIEEILKESSRFCTLDGFQSYLRSQKQKEENEK